MIVGLVIFGLVIVGQEGVNQVADGQVTRTHKKGISVSMLVSENIFFILTLESGVRRKRLLNISFETYNRISFIENCIPRHSRAITERKITDWMRNKFSVF